MIFHLMLTEALLNCNSEILFSEKNHRIFKIKGFWDNSVVVENFKNALLVEWTRHIVPPSSLSPSKHLSHVCFLYGLWIFISWSILNGLTLFLIVRGSGDHDDTLKNFFCSKNKSFDITGKITWFWSTFDEQPTVTSDINRRYRVSKFV